MNVVVYTRDFEPITIIDLPMWALEHGARLGSVNVALLEEIKPREYVRSKEPIESVARKVRLEFMSLRLPDKHTWFIVTDDEEVALLLKPSWLPGQRRAVNKYEKWNRELADSLMRVLARGVGGH